MKAVAVAQGGKFAPPDYIISTLQLDPPQFLSKISVTINGQHRIFTATSNSKQEAKKNSAAMALNACIRESGQ